MQPASQPQLTENQHAKNAFNQYGGNAYQDGIQKAGVNNWTGGRVPATNQQFSNT